MFIKFWNALTRNTNVHIRRVNKSSQDKTEWWSPNKEFKDSSIVLKHVEHPPDAFQDLVDKR